MIMNMKDFFKNYKKIITCTYKVLSIFSPNNKMYECSKNAYKNYIYKLKLYETYINQDYIYNFKSEK